MSQKTVQNRTPNVVSLTVAAAGDIAGTAVSDGSAAGAGGDTVHVAVIPKETVTIGQMLRVFLNITGTKTRLDTFPIPPLQVSAGVIGGEPGRIPIGSFALGNAHKLSYNMEKGSDLDVHETHEPFG